MSILLSKIGRYLAHKAGILVLILVVLLGLHWVRSEWEEMKRIEERIVEQQKLIEGLDEDLIKLEEEGKREAERWAEEAEVEKAKLNAELDEIDQKIAAAGEEWKKKLEELKTKANDVQDAEHYIKRAELKRDRAAGEINWFEKKIGPLDAGNKAKLALAEGELVARQQSLREAQAAKRGLEAAMQSSPAAEWEERRKEKQREIETFVSGSSPSEQTLHGDIERKKREIASVKNAVEEQQLSLLQNPTKRLLKTVKEELPKALLILAGVILSPLLFKIMMYWGVAPLVQRLKPVLIYPVENAHPVPEPDRSAVSVPVKIASDEELLVLGNFLQRSSESSKKSSQMFLNARIPFTSMASGMFMLTRIRPRYAEGTEVVVSPQDDAFGEVSILEVPEGSSMILQPRSLAGVVKKQGERVRISRKWRLLSLHAWLTLQLRYLVFHGPCRIILKGCRGVRAEEAEEGKPKVINQASTIGFSGNLKYRNTRCETFMSYLRGQEDLFNDCFEGENGRFVYEEMPAGGRKGGIMGRGLEGAIDACLKVLGI